MSPPPIGWCDCRHCQDAIVARAALAAAAVIAYDRIEQGSPQLVGLMGDAASIVNLSCDYGRLYRAAERAHGARA